MGNVRVFVLMAGMTALFGVVGWTLGGSQGMWLALGIAAVMNMVAWYGSAGAALRAYQARVVSPTEAPELHAIVDRLRQRAGLPMPAVAIAPHRQPNAFATGRNPGNAVVCVTVLQFAISRSREFKADAAGAEISGKPLALASALEKLEASARRVPMQIPPAMAPLAQVDPLAGFGGSITRLFSTHPPTAERVERLKAIAARTA